MTHSNAAPLLNSFIKYRPRCGEGKGGLVIANHYFYIPEFKRRIDILCRRLKLSPNNLAKRAHINPSSLYHARQNLTCVSLKSLMKLADTYHVSIDWLVGRDDQK